jgi:TM2 domain-containing membrane protein YozV
MKNHSQIQKIGCKIAIFITFLQITGCYSAKFINKTDLPVSDGNYSFHGKKSTYPFVKNAIISNGRISGKVDFGKGNYSLNEKFRIYVSNDSLIRINNDEISIPLDGITRISIDTRAYSFKKSDPFNPISAGIASLIIPGLGQMISGKPGRGVLFLTGFTGCLAVSAMAFVKSAFSADMKYVAKTRQVSEAGLIGALCIDLWSIGDAVNVAKVNNLVLRNKHKSSYNLKINPFIDTPDYGLKHNIPIGLDFKVTF